MFLTAILANILTLADLERYKHVTKGATTSIIAHTNERGQQAIASRG